jgi:tellurite resistance protein TerC
VLLDIASWSYRKLPHFLERLPWYTSLDDREFALHLEGPMNTWDTVVVLTVIFILLCYDLLVAPIIRYSWSNHLYAFIFVFGLSALFLAFVWQHHGREVGELWLTGFMMEWALSLDNLFAFHLIFRAFATPPGKSTRIAMTLGIYVAMGLRFILFLFFAELFKLGQIVNTLVGVFLIMTSVPYFCFDDGANEMAKSRTVGAFKWLLGTRLEEEYCDTWDSDQRHDMARSGGYFADLGLLMRDGEGRYRMTMLFLVVCIIPVVDLLLSIDNVTAQTGQIKNTFVNLTSCMMGMYSLRSLFFIIEGIIDYFEFVKYAVFTSLTFIGVNMICKPWYTMPLSVTLYVISALFGISICASAIKQRRCASLWYSYSSRYSEPADIPIAAAG